MADAPRAQAGDARPGRACPVGYRYGARALRAGHTMDADTLYVAGGLYGNPFALESLLDQKGIHYAREDIVEAYYNLHIWRGVFYALDAQYITHPGYNQDRGPVLVESVRMHVDF